jgi:hypothetical protein
MHSRKTQSRESKAASTQLGKKSDKFKAWRWLPYSRLMLIFDLFHAIELFSR